MNITFGFPVGRHLVFILALGARILWPAFTISEEVTASSTTLRSLIQLANSNEIPVATRAKVADRLLAEIHSVRRTLNRHEILPLGSIPRTVAVPTVDACISLISDTNQTAADRAMWARLAVMVSESFRDALTPLDQRVFLKTSGDILRTFPHELRGVIPMRAWQVQFVDMKRAAVKSIDEIHSGQMNLLPKHGNEQVSEDGAMELRRHVEEAFAALHTQQGEDVNGQELLNACWARWLKQDKDGMGTDSFIFEHALAVAIQTQQNLNLMRYVESALR